MKSFKYTTSFASTIKSIPPVEKDKYLALASSAELKKLLPNINLEANYDILPIAFQVCNVNQFNKNDDGISSKDAVAVYSNFVNKYININHVRDKVIGTILNAWLTDEADKILTDEEASSLTRPFNISLSGLIWKVVNPKVAEVIESSADPLSDFYQSLFTSFEVGFDDFSVIASSGSWNLEDCEELSAEHAKYLRCEGGAGKLPDGRKVFRLIKGGLTPLGCAITENPAARLSPLVVKTEDAPVETSDADTEKAATEAQILTLEDNSDKKENICSQTEITDVKEFSKIMKFNSITDVTDENLKLATASAVADLIQEELKKTSEQFSKDLSAKDVALKAAEDKLVSLITESETLKTSLKEIQEKLQTLEASAAAAAKLEEFNSRMAKFDADYELSKEDREVLARQLQDMDKEAYEAFLVTAATLMKEKSKEFLAQKAKEVIVATVKDEVTASVITEESKDTLKDTLKDASVVSPVIPNTSVAEPISLKEKFQKAFSVEDGWNIKLNKI